MYSADENNFSTSINQIESALDFLLQLQQSISNIIHCDPESFNSGEMGNCIERLIKKYEESLHRLKNPLFRLATIGTTSSGKSTLVNALIGRCLAPIEADEMSAGVLTITHSKESRLIVKPTQNAVWETGEWTGLSDKDIYDKLRSTKEENGYDGVMVAYHKEKKIKADIEAPKIIIEAPILPVLWNNLLQLPNDVQFEIIDLPGLKSVKDRKNLELLQQHVKNAFSLVVLDYTQTDDENRAQLLKELEDVVKFMQGRTDAMIFILNKVNLRSEEDLPIKHRLDKLQQEIKERLSLNSTPDLIPINAQLLFYIQCAWGANKEPYPVGDERNDFLKKFKKSCGNTVLSEAENDSIVLEWFNKYFMKLNALCNMDSKEFTKLLKWGHEWSNGKQLWNLLKQRISERFPELVIFPAVQGILTAFEEFCAKTEEMARIRKIQTIEVVEKERKRIQEELYNVKTQLENSRHDFREKIRASVDDFKKNKSEDTSRAISRLGSPKGLKNLPFVIEEVRLDLFNNIINPIRIAFESYSTIDELRNKLQRSLTDVDLDNLVKSYDAYSRKFFTQEAALKGLKIGPIKKDDKKAKENIEEAIKRCKSLYQNMRSALSHRAEFVIQSQSQLIEQAIIDILRSETDSFVNWAKEYIGEKIHIIFANFDSLIKSADIKLPDQFFELPEAQNIKSETKQEKIGEETFTYTTGTCFTSNHTGTRDKLGNIAYETLNLPSAEGMALHWDSGIKRAENSLWDKLADWMEKTFDSVLTHFLENVQMVTIYIRL